VADIIATIEQMSQVAAQRVTAERQALMDKYKL
jgi:hypothetical protein